MARYQETNTERQILEAAERVFLLQGFAGARTTEIARQAGVTHAMLHYYFHTKEELFQTILKGKLAVLMESIRVMLVDEKMPIMDAIEMGMRRHFEYIRKNASLPLFLLNELSRNSEILTNVRKQMLPKLEDILFDAQQRLDEAAEEGVIRFVRAQTLFMDIAMLNISAFLFQPVIEFLTEDRPLPMSDYLEQRLEENVQLVRLKLKV